MRIERRLIERIEGEATLYFEMRDEAVDFVSIAFAHSRGMEQILQGKEARDALVYTPRVCGICGHSHLYATVRALEDALKNSGVEVTLTPKAQYLRDITLLLELIQNHFKGFYLVIAPELATLTCNPFPDALKLKGIYAASLCNKALALIGGQAPHSSYMIPGGITCDPSQLDLMRLGALVDEAIVFVERELMGVSLETLMEFVTCKDFNALNSDAARFERQLIGAGTHEKGHAYDCFVVMGAHTFSTPAKLKRTVAHAIDPQLSTLQKAFAPHETSLALNALYKGHYYEGGPLARAMSNDITLVKNMHRRYKDSSYTRAMARLLELPHLLLHVKQLLTQIDLSEASYIKPKTEWKHISGEGLGVVEAPRGPLIHKVKLHKGTIETYQMITPTQWNLGSGDKNHLGVAQKAMIGLRTQEEAQFVFKTFDVCSVCTTH